jgi:SAM-dependent methyltransferase
MARKPNFVRKKKRKVHGAAFWDQEYTNPTHLKLSINESEDLAKFTRWMQRRERADLLTTGASVIDVGTGNGRNLLFLQREFGLAGVGIDISAAAISQAKLAGKGLPLKYHVGSIAAPLPVPDESQAFALDMMTSHFLTKGERESLRDELHRVILPGGYLFMKTFLKDGDLHTERLLKEHPGTEAGTYIHPVMGVAEYVYSEEELLAFLGEKFLIRKIYRSHRHVSRGKARKRRTIVVYAEKDYK